MLPILLKNFNCAYLPLSKVGFINAYTFHGFAFSELKRNVIHTGYDRKFTVIDQDDTRSIIKLIKSQLGINNLHHTFPDDGQILSIISKSVTKLMSIHDVISLYYPKHEIFKEKIELVAERFKQFKREENEMDFDDLLSNFWKLLTGNEYLRNTLREKYRYIMIDEYQDTDRIQAKIAETLAGGHKNIMVVGDDAQSIYAFRGTDFRNILSFQDMFENTKIITIEQNYRSTKEILHLGNAVMTNAEERYEKNLFTDKSNQQKPFLFRPLNNHHESLFVVDTIEDYRNQGCSLNNIAVLFRNGNFSYDLEAKLTMRGLPFKKYGGTEFRQKAHIKDVVAFLKIGLNNEDILGWHRVLKLFRGIGDVKASRIIDKIVKQGKGIEYLREIQLADLYHLVLSLGLDRNSLEQKIKQIASFYKPIFDNNPKYQKKRWNDIEQLIDMATNHISPTEFINSLAMNPNDDQDGEDKEYLTLSTIHSAKGLEWDVVFILSVNDGCIPYLPEKRSPEEMDEEVRLFHVAITRAKDHLYLLAPIIQSYGDKNSRLSRFLTDRIIANCLEVAELSFVA